MKRRRGELNKIKARAKLWSDYQKNNVLSSFNSGLKPNGYYRNKHPFDCGRSNCGVCSSHKKFGHTQTRQELKANESFKQQLREYND